ncbi:MAG TPA: Ig-like domain-containing protein [Pyrinomonadaceae bacterium]|nr:Ig-like domain-containing protein [Pyrinomonadaceae bacterium]
MKNTRLAEKNRTASNNSGRHLRAASRTALRVFGAPRLRVVFAALMAYLLIALPYAPVLASTRAKVEAERARFSKPAAKAVGGAGHRRDDRSNNSVDGGPLAAVKVTAVAAPAATPAPSPRGGRKWSDGFSLSSAYMLLSILDALAPGGGGPPATAATPATTAQQAGVVTSLFGPRKFVRGKGAPFTEVERFTLPADVAGPFTLEVQNGEPGGANRVSSATIKLNGVEIFGQSDFSQNVPTLSREVTLAANNTLEVKLASQPGSFLVINVKGNYVDRTPPSVSIAEPKAGLVTIQPEIVVAGAASDPGQYASGIASVYVNDRPAVYNQSTGTWSIANVSLKLGANTLVARAVDGAGNEARASVTVTLELAVADTTPPALAITSPADNYVTQAETVAVSGTVSDSEPDASGVAGVTVNGAEAARDVNAGTWSASVPLSIGDNAVTAHATDKAGNVSVKTINVKRDPTPPPDAAAPKVVITSPANNAVVYGASTSVSGTAVDEGENATGVRRVFVNGEEAVYNAGSHAWSVEGIALDEGDNLVVVEAEDGATPPNKGRAEINVRRRTVAAPKLTITNPREGEVLSGDTVTLAGEAASGDPDVPVTVKVGGEPAAVAGGMFTKTVKLSDGTNTINVSATDALGQTSQASVTVVADLRPPTVTLRDLPAAVQPGGTYVIRADASDNLGIAVVDFLVDGQQVAAVAQAPYEFSFNVPETAAPDRLLSVAVVARDLTGATASDTANTRVVGPSGVSGYVFDDATGYAIEGATAAVAGGPSMMTAALGVYSFVSAAPSGVVRLSREGYTPAERSYEGASGGGTSLFDARLTRLDANANVLTAAGGTAAGDGGRLQVALGAGAFPAGTDVRVTSVSPQGLANLLPFGWSPVPGAVVDVRPADQAGAPAGLFTSPARLTVSATQGLSAGTPLVLARYDEAAHAWRVVAAALTAGEGGSLAADIPAAGQYAFLVADAGASAPPAPADGQPLPTGPSAQPSALDAATATAAASPRSALMSEQARSTISVTATAPSKLPSGVSVEVTFEETYNLLSDGNPLLVDRPTQDFVLYAYPAATAAEPNRLGAFFIAKPTRTDIKSTQLRSANVHVVIRSGRAATTGVLVGAAGGSVTTPDGAELRLGSGALSGDTPVFLTGLPAEQAGPALPEGYEVVGAVEVDLSGSTLAASGTLVIPTTSGDNSRVVVARSVSAGGVRGLKVVARAVVVDGKLHSTTDSPAVPQPVALRGVREGGRYLFVRVPVAFGYVAGAVTDGPNGAPSVAARVSVDRTPFVDVTGADGRFVVVGEVGGLNELVAASTVTDATGVASAALAAQDAVAAADIFLASAPLRVASVSPADSAADVIATSPVTVTFSKPVAPATVTTSNFRVTTEAGNPVLGKITLLAGNRAASFTPAAALSGSTRYKVTVSQNVLDLYGKPLAQAFASTFTTAAVIPVDDRLKREQIRIGYPDAQGLATVTIPALAVPVGSVLIALNNTSGGTVTTVASTTETVLRLHARVGDEIVLFIRQPDGAEYQVTQAAYRRDDGVTSVTENGGTVISADGKTVLDVPKGGIKGQAEITLTPKGEETITTPRPGDFASVPFGAGVEIKAEGNYTVEKELHLELPAHAQFEEGRRVAFMSPQKMTIDGREIEVWESVTSGRVEGGRFKTNTPPFYGLGGGLLGIITFVYVFAPVTRHVVYGKVTDATTGEGRGNCVILISHENITNPWSVTGGATVARTSPYGGYAHFDFTPNFQDGKYVIAIDDVNHRFGATFAVPQTASGGGYVEGRFLQGLASFVYAKGDITLPPVLIADGAKPPPQLSAYARQMNISSEEQDPLFKLNVATLGNPVRVYVRATAALAQLTGQLVLSGLEPKALQWQPSDLPNTYHADLPPLTSEGTYTINVQGSTTANDPRSTTRLSYNFNSLRNPNTRPPLAGPPRVLSVAPASGSRDVDMVGDIRVEFTEPVEGLAAGENIFVEDQATKERIGGIITSGGLPLSGPVSSIVYRPTPALVGGRSYCLRIQPGPRETKGVHDTTNIPLDGEYTGEGDTSPQEFISCFSTFNGMLLTRDPVADPGDRIAVAGDYAVTTHQELQGRHLLSVYDVSQPHKPLKTGELRLPQWAWSVAVAEGQGIVANGVVYNRVAVVATSAPSDLKQYANVWVVSLDDPAQPKLVGVTSLYLPLATPALPHVVRIFEGRAYVGNMTSGGVMAVDLARSIWLTQTDLGRPRQLSQTAPPEGLAVYPAGGYGHAGKRQSVNFYNSDDPWAVSAGSGVDVMSQTVLAKTFQGVSPTGTMPVAYAVDSVKGTLVSVGFGQNLDNLNDRVDTSGDKYDDRVLSITPVPGEPSSRIRLSPGQILSIRDDAGNPVGTALADLALVASFRYFSVFDVTMPQQTDGLVQPKPLSTKSWAELDKELTGMARNFDVEGSLAYVAFDNQIAVVDFSDPYHPRVIAKVKDVPLGYSSVAVKDGFIYTISPDSGGLRVSIARPNSVLFVSGRSRTASGGPDEVTCSNPVIIDRQTRLMRQDANISFLVYGAGEGASGAVHISRGGQVIATVPASMESTGTVMVGRAKWSSDDPIDLTQTYTAELSINAGQVNEYFSLKSAIPFAFLIPEYQDSMGFVEGGPPTTYTYLLGANSEVDIKIKGGSVAGGQRGFGLNSEAMQKPNLPPGRYPFVLSAKLIDDPTVADEVAGVVEIAREEKQVRRPGNTVVSDVDLGTGSLGLTYTDFSIPGRGMGLSVTRSYNSGAANIFSPFGYGWHFNFQITISYNPAAREYTILGGDGSGQRFKEDNKNSQGEMLAEKPYHGTLVKNQDGSLDFYTTQRIKYHFPGALWRDRFSFYSQAYLGTVEYIEDPNENRLTFYYDDDGRMYKAVDSSGREMLLKYEEAETPFTGLLAPTSNINSVRACARGDDFSILRKGLVKAAVGRAWRVKEVKAPGDLLVQYEYDARGNLVKVTRKGTDGISRPAADYVWQYLYDPDEQDTAALDTRHLMKEAVDPNNNSTLYDYDLGQVGAPAKAVRRPEGVAHEFAYSFENGQVSEVAVTDGRSNPTAYKLRDGYVTQIVAPRGATTSVQFNEEGLKIRETDPEGMVTDYGYDGRGNLVSRRMSGGSAVVATSAVYDQTFGKPLSETDANGRTTRYTLDGAGNVTSIALPTGKSISMTYAGNGDLLSTTDERGLTTQNAYDEYGNARSATKALGPGVTATTTSEYDVRSRLRSTADSVRAHTSKTYDALDRVVEEVVKDPTGIREGTTTTYVYRAGGEVTRANVAGGSQSYSADYTVDALGRTTTIRESFGLAGSYTIVRAYDGNSNLLSETDRRGVTTSYEYDALNFKTKTTVSGPFGPPVVTSEVPNLVGSVVTFTDMYAQQTTFEYDGVHRERLRRYPGGYTEYKSLDPNGNLLTFTDRKGRTTTFAYDPSNRLTMRRDPAGRVENWTYADDSSNTVTLTKTPQGLVVVTRTDALGRPLGRDVKQGGVTYQTTYTYDGRDCAIKDPRGVVTKKTHSAFGDVGEVRVEDSDYSEKHLYAAFGVVKYRRDANGRETHFAIDSLNRIKSAAYADGFGESWAYDGVGNVTGHTDRRGVFSAMTYDNVSRLRTRTVGDVPVLSIEYADSAGTETRTDGNGHASVYRFDGLRRLVSLTNAEQKTKNFVYDGIDLLQESDFKQQFVNYAYDPVSRVTQVIDRAGQATLVSHSDVGGYTRKVTDRRGNSRTETHDALGRLLSVKAGAEAVAAFEYDENGNRKAMTDGRGNRTVYEYDALNRLKSASHSGLQVESYTYDGVGNVLTYHDGRGGKVVMTYDGLDHPKTRDDGAGNVTTYKFDGEGLLLERTDPKGQAYRTSFSYNALRSLESVADAAGSEWRFTYDNNQNLKSLRDPRTHTVNYDYDELDRPRSVTQPGGLATTYRHDPNGNLELLTDPSGQKLVTTYDALDRPLTASHEGTGGNLSLDYQFGHDPEGNLVSVTETAPAAAGGTAATRSYSRTYDARNRLLSSTDPRGRAVSYLYDAADNVLSFTDAAGKKTGYEYDPLNRLKKATLPGGTEVNYGWYADGLLASVAYGSGMSRAYAYDEADRLTKVANQFAAGAGEEFDYAYDPNGNRERETRKLNGQVERVLAYGYDEVDRLRSVTTRGSEAGPQIASLAYTYDEVGNRKTEKGTGYAGQPIDRTYDYDELNRLTHATGYEGGDLVYRYDRNGNLREVEQGGAVNGAYEYDARNQLRRVLGAGGAEVARYDYDFGRRRTAKTAGGLEQQFVYGGGGVVNEFAADGRLLGRYDYGTDALRGEFAGEGERWLFSDALGSVTSVAAVGGDGTAAVAGRNEYGAWGELLAGAGASANAFGYTGQRLDAETGLMPLGNGERYYSPGLGRFVQQDSFPGLTEMPASLNRFSYAHNNPVLHTDPSGKFIPLVAAAVLLLKVALVASAVDSVIQVAEALDGNRNSFDLKRNIQAAMHAPIDTLKAVFIPGYAEYSTAADFVDAGQAFARGDMWEGTAKVATSLLPGRNHHRVNADVGGHSSGPGTARGGHADRSGRAHAEVAIEGRAGTASASVRLAEGAANPQALPESQLAPPSADAEFSRSLRDENIRANVEQSRQVRAAREAAAKRNAERAREAEQSADGTREAGSEVGVRLEGVPPEGVRVLFGQRRVSPEFSGKQEVPHYLRDQPIKRIAKRIRRGKMSTDAIVIHAFWYEGQLVSENSRGLTTLSMAGKKPTNVRIIEPDAEVRARLDQTSVLGDKLPSTRIAVTPSQADIRVLWEVPLPD